MIKDRYPRETFPGNMPIRVLRNNILSSFQSFGKDSMNRHKEWVEKGLINPAIVFLLGKDRVRTPYVRSNSRKIVVQDTFLSYLWVITYFFIILNEEGFQPRLSGKTFDGKIRFDSPILKDAALLFNWAVSLANEYSDWRYDLPNPEIIKKGTTEYYILKINALFLDALNFILLHECCHLVNGHFELVKEINKKQHIDIAENDLLILKELENDADNFAINSLFTDANNNEKKLIKGLAVMLANVSLLFLIKNPQSVSCRNHPDIDTRISNCLEYLGKDIKSFDYIWQIACFASMIFFRFHNISVDNAPAETSIDLFKRYLDVFDEIKAYDRR